MIKIHELDLNESILLPDGTKVLRVPDHWIYIFTNGSSQTIPFSYEFSKQKARLEITKDKVANLVSEYYCISDNFYKVKRKDGNKAIAKKILIKLLYENLNLTFEDIAIYMRYSGHSTCSIAYGELNKFLTYKGDIINEYQDILRGFKALRLNK